MMVTSKGKANKQRTVRPFDFRRPNKLNRDHVRTLEIVQETFARQFTTVLSSSLRAVSNVTVESIEQLSYDEYVRATPNPTYLSVLSVSPLPGVALFQLPLQISFAAVDMLLGGHGKGNDFSRPLTDIEVTLLRDLMSRVLSELRYAFESVVEFDPTVVQVESNPQFAQVAAPSDMIVVTTFDVRINSANGRATLAFPYGSLTPVLDSFTGNVVMAERDAHIVETARAHLRERVIEAPVDVSVQFDPIFLTSGEIVSLRPGDVIPLGQSVSSALTVAVANSPTFIGRPARRGKRLACQIIAPIKEPAKEVTL
ncbi:MAG: flagellar motor switch protein FliM [Acidimicrobiia bacterium]